VKKDKRIKYIKNKHKQGPAGARNQGIEKAKGEYIAFLDSDDEWKNNHINDIMKEFSKNPTIDWIYANSERKKDNKIIVKSVFNQLWKGKKKFKVKKEGNISILKKKNLLTNALKYEFNPGFQVSMIKKELFKKIKIDESLLANEDKLFALEAIKNNLRLAYLNKIHLTYLVHEDNLSKCNPNKKIIDQLKINSETEKFYKKIPKKVELNKIQNKIIKNKIADLYFWQFGYNCYLNIKNHKKAKEYFLKGLKLRPFNFKYWKTFIKRIILF
jgi:glycosyltransferase involved in cell wall biosynthesis